MKNKMTKNAFILNLAFCLVYSRRWNNSFTVLKWWRPWWYPSTFRWEVGHPRVVCFPYNYCYYYCQSISAFLFSCLLSLVLELCSYTHSHYLLKRSPTFLSIWLSFLIKGFQFNTDNSFSFSSFSTTNSVLEESVIITVWATAYELTHYWLIYTDCRKMCLIVLLLKSLSRSLFDLILYSLIISCTFCIWVNK